MEKLTKQPALSFAEAAGEAYRKLFVCKGRSRRSEYWWAFLIVAIAKLACMATPFTSVYVSRLLTLALLPATIRRLHDTGRSGWWAAGWFALDAASTTTVLLVRKFGQVALTASTIVGLVTIAYIVAMVVFLCKDSHKGANKYGPSPKHEAR